jgi:hypothetical protein
MYKVAGLLSLFIILPIWYFLFYRILEAVNATELMWFLFWVYLPVSVFASILVKLSGKQ